MHNILYKSHSLYREVNINDTEYFIFQTNVSKREAINCNSMILYFLNNYCLLSIKGVSKVFQGDKL